MPAMIKDEPATACGVGASSSMNNHANSVCTTGVIVSDKDTTIRGKYCIATVTNVCPMMASDPMETTPGHKSGDFGQSKTPRVYGGVELAHTCPGTHAKHKNEYTVITIAPMVWTYIPLARGIPTPSGPNHFRMDNA